MRLRGAERRTQWSRARQCDTHRACTLCECAALFAIGGAVQVAFAFQIGNFLKQNLTYVEGPLGLLAMGLTTVQSWMLVLSYRARFEAASPVHRMLDAVEGLLFAAAQHNIVADLESFKDVHMYVFLAITIALRVIAIVRRLELAAVYEHERFGSVRSTCVKESAGLLFEVFVLACGFAASTAITLFEALLAGWVVHVISLQGPTFMVSRSLCTRFQLWHAPAGQVCRHSVRLHNSPPLHRACRNLSQGTATLRLTSSSRCLGAASSSCSCSERVFSL